MSFILDALKKSEAERQRQAGPTLLELRITHPRRRYPLWSLVVGVLLAANIAVLLVFVLNRTPPATAPSTASTSTPAPPTAAPARITAAASSVASSTSAVTKVAPLAPATTAAAPTVPAATANSADNVPDTSAQTRNPSDYEPALPPGSQSQPEPPAPPSGAGDYADLPSIDQIGGNIPAMQLDLLVSSNDVGERYALINMHRVREGDVLPNGARVLAITPNGVAMDYRGQDFLLRPGGTAQ